jgi:hypothetical protein
MVVPRVVFDAGACHVAMLAEVAVRTFPTVGGATRETLTEAPVVCKALASTKFVDPVMVLFVNVSVVSRPARVVVAVGRVIVPVLEMVLIIGAVRVLLDSVWAVARSD